MRAIDDSERRRRLGRRHHLARSARSNDVVALAEDLAGLHASDPPTVFLSAAARMSDPGHAVAALERSLYDDRTLVRTLGMRRTMFVVPVDDVAMVQAACTDRLVPAERRRLVRMIEEGGIAADGATWLAGVEEAAARELETRREATASELSKVIPGFREQLSFGKGTRWAGKMGMSTRVLLLLSTEQRAVRGRPEGSWTSSRYRWSPMAEWLPGGVAAMPAAEARAGLVRRWLRTFGPGTTADLKWWTGWTVGLTRAALVDVDAQEVALDDGTGWVVPGDDEPSEPVEPWVSLLPSLDPTTMGWRGRRWYLGDHGPALFDRNGNAGPTVWVDGRIAGGWAQRRDGEVVVRVLDDVGREAVTAVEHAAAELGERLGDVRISSRFPTPLQTELRG